MAKHIPNFELFPAEERKKKVVQDGRPYFRSYTLASADTLDNVDSKKHFFFDTNQELTTFIAETFSSYRKIKLIFNGHYNEWFVFGCVGNDPKKKTILGFCNNIHKNNPSHIRPSNEITIELSLKNA